MSSQSVPVLVDAAKARITRSREFVRRRIEEITDAEEIARLKSLDSTKAIVETTPQEVHDLLAAYPPTGDTQEVYDALKKGSGVKNQQIYVQCCDVLAVAGEKPPVDRKKVSPPSTTKETPDANV